MKIELLAPAGDCEIGRAAIDAGADAVYIGGPRFGARVAVGNDMDDIAALCDYAHSFGSRIYMTMNTILFDNELRDAERIAHRAYTAGVDALIVQDMAFTQMSLPPIALHASTQTHNATPERVKFLEQCGFSRVVLERGLTLDEIRAIRRTTNVELEAFVHGAICVSHSGQCYLGHVLCERGGNRGGCAQPCRSRYNLIRGESQIIARDRELLSVRDLDLSDKLDELIDAGVVSLKIEGRLKERGYVVNNTAYYDTKLHALGVERSSVGAASHGFTPDPLKSFSRGLTTYYFDGHSARVGVTSGRPDPGEPLGRVARLDGQAIVLDLRTGVVVNNGDGVCFYTRDGMVQGTNVNIAQGNKLFLNKLDGISIGDEIYRNLDRAFEPQSCRKISISIAVDITPTDITIRASDIEGRQTELSIPNSFDIATNEAMADRNIRNGLAKSGDTIFDVTHLDINRTVCSLPFIPNGVVNGLRRDLLERLLQQRLLSYDRLPSFRFTGLSTTCQSDLSSVGTIDYRGNVSNAMAEMLYRRVGFDVVERALESMPSSPERHVGREVMTTPFCIRRELGICLKEQGANREPLWLENNGARLDLLFDCQECRMRVIYRGRGATAR